MPGWMKRLRGHGGEEFVVLLTKTEQENASMTAKKLRTAI